jgi:hypothetical protein
VVDPREALRRVRLDPDECEVTDVAHNRWLTPGIWQVTGPHGRCIVKCLGLERPAVKSAADRHWVDGAERQEHWNYWAREWLAYTRGLTEVYAGSGLVAPSLLASDQGENDVVLLLEYADGMPADTWGLDGYATAAAALGRAQGRLLVESSSPAFPWLSRQFLREYSGGKPVDWTLLDDEGAWAQPVVRRNFPAELRAATGALHAARNRLYAIAESLPRVLCHLDFWTKNLLAAPGGDVVLLDWAFAGDGAIGEDPGNLVPDAVLDHFVPAERAPELHQAVLTAYQQGLVEAGWDGDLRLAELGMCASAVKYDWLTPAMLTVASAERQYRYGGMEEIDADERFRERGIALLHNAELAQRAIALADELGM